MAKQRAHANVTANLNHFYDQARHDLERLLHGAGIGSAVIFNATGQPVTFYAYNYVDVVYWVSAQKTLVAADRSGTVAASGSFFKIHPNDHSAEEFLVKPGKAYVYHGPGDLEAL